MIRGPILASSFAWLVRGGLVRRCCRRRKFKILTSETNLQLVAHDLR